MQVSFVIPLYNQLAHTRACLESLHATLPAGLTYEIILVDDASTDGTREFLRELAPPHVVLRNDPNLGYAASNNRAARIAQGRFLALLNNDLILAPGWLKPMLEAAALPATGVVGNIQLSAATGELDHAGIIFHQGGYPGHYRAALAEVQAAGPLITMPAVTAACCLVDREWFCRSGGFDEGYRNGFEDVDLCLRARSDGLVNRVVTRSVIRHHVSSSEGRGAFEHRNARRFLARWQPRTSALEKEWALTTARAQAAAEARRFFTPLSRRLGFGPATLRRQYRAALVAVRREQFNQTRPIRVAVDLMRMAPGGVNGGIKPFIYSILAEIGRQRGEGFNFAVFCLPTLSAELTAAFLRQGDYVLEPGEQSSLRVRRYAGRGMWREDGTLPSGPAGLKRGGIDVLYAPFGTSPFMDRTVPTVSFIADLLHRELPAALPPEEVNHRENWFQTIARESAWFQCNSHWVQQCFTAAYDVHPSRCFHTYNVVQNRLPTPAADTVLPAAIPAGPFFFYPANAWPHKNHEALLVAYHLYAIAAGSRAWPLVLTGAADKRMDLVREMALGLGLGDRVIFPGHLDDPAFAALWSRAGALVFPSLHEGFGIPLLEAMRFGTPIIATDLPVLREVAGDAFLPVESRDPQALAAAMRRLAIHENLRAGLVDRGRARLAAFSLGAEAGRLAHFLEAAARRQTP